MCVSCQPQSWDRGGDYTVKPSSLFSTTNEPDSKTRGIRKGSQTHTKGIAFHVGGEGLVLSFHQTSESGRPNKN